jgi:hypothetical protein
MDRLIMTPADPGFDEILYTAPPPDVVRTDNHYCYVVGVDGIPRAVTQDRQLDDYLWGGEYDEMMGLFGEDDSLIFED